ncbi:GNAT family N-acetyltransferase [Streptomyces albireticuli]|nr:GNAT family N-acetyltransferase [Streptomyces albireticuli]
MSDLLHIGASPTEADVDAWHSVVTAAHAADLAPTVPAPCWNETAGGLRVPRVRSRHINLAVPMPRGGSGGFAGVAALRLFDEAENRTTAWIERLAVRPEMRRRGIGSRLWEALRAVLTEEGRTSVGLEIELGGAGEQFALACDFRCALSLRVYVLDLAREDGAPGPSLPDGYRFLEWTGAVPSQHAPAFALAHQAMADVPRGDLAMRPRAWDAERVRVLQQADVDRGVMLLTVVALAPDGSHAGYSVLGLPSPDAVRAKLYETAVAPAHRGLGLGRAVSLRNLELLREQRLPVREIAGTMADHNEPMRAVGKPLGYRRERSIRFYQARWDG